jgi:O-acetyl-ADP-ribose deacetylase (regulator of RNase III)
MTQWQASVGEILDCPADALICSANPQLNLSGGVGGEFALRYGNEMQRLLHDWLAAQGRKFVEPGEVVAAPSCGSPFKLVVHAVAIDAFYDTGPEVIRRAYAAALAAIGEAGCRSVAAACLACGYGRMAPAEFVAAIRPTLGTSLAGIERVTFVSRDAELIELLQAEIGGAAKNRGADA